MALAFQRSRAIVLALLVTASAAVETRSRPQVPAQSGSPASTAAPTGLIVGKTVDGVTGLAMAGAIVSVSRALPPASIRPDDPAPLNLGPTRVISDNNGRFMFNGLGAGIYTVSASKPGYIDAAFGRRSATDLGSQPLLLRDGERRGDLTLALWKRASLGGTVVDEAGEPVIGIQLRVLRRTIAGGARRFTQAGNQPTTDDRGMYRLSDLTPGDYIVCIVTTQISVPDSLQEAYAAAGKGGSQQDFLRELDRSRGLLSSGGPVSVSTGQRVGSSVLQTPFGFGMSGEIAAPPVQGGKVFVYPTVFYPAAASPSAATVVSLGPGDERSTIDFQLRPVVTSRVSGVLMGPTGPEAHTSLDLMPASFDLLQRDYDFAAASTTTDGNGAFVFLGVPPGAYTVRVLKLPPRPVTTSSMTTVIQTGSSTIMSGGGPSTPPPVPSEPTYWASVPVTVGEKDVADVEVTLHTGARLSGRLEFDGTATKPTTERLMQLSLQVENADARTTSSNMFTMGRGVVDANANFKTYQLPAGRYVIRGPVLPNWMFKGAFLDGRDVSDMPLDLEAEDIGDIVLTFSDRPTELTGTARSSTGPDETATILVFPAQPNLWSNHGPFPRRFKSVRAGTEGVFRATSVPAGDYIVVGVHGSFPSDWQDPAFLRRLMALGTRATVGDGEIKTVDVTTKEIK